MFETKYNEDRGLLLYGENLVGSLALTDITITNLQGMLTDALTKVYLTGF
jgi:hypothetical protein